MAAGQGFKTFTTGEVLTAGDVNGYLMQGINVFANATARDAAITAPAEGQFAFTKDNNSLWYYDGAAWVASGATGDIEGVTAGVGISGGGTSGTVTVTNSMATAIDAKGDLVPGTGADTFARLPIGTNGQVLTADSAESTGMKWATAAGGTKNFTLLNTGGTALSGSTTVTVSGISNADVIFVYISGASAGTNAYNVSFRVNGLSTGIYNYAGPYVNCGSGYSANNFGIRGGNSEVRCTIGEWSDNASSTMSGWFRITGGATSGQKIIDFQTGATAGGGTGQDLVWGGGYIDTSATITSISIIQDDGINFDAGTVRVYTSA